MSDLRERIVFRWKLDGGELVDVAIAIALEEAARKAASMYRNGQIGADIAAAIRALIPDTTPSPTD